ncbi:MAG TPA: metallophosphoesterase family protein [Novosphingobium sp.]|nr:metallophosphoesterase family protein [Novosphingobium sp.]
MIATLRQLFRAQPKRALPAVPSGERVYAVGDIHGRLDLLEALAEGIEIDDEARGSTDTTIILLGDLVDRGPDSAGVIAFSREWQARRPVRILLGNHEEMFLAAFDSGEVLRQFLRFGGRETVLSYPVDHGAYMAADMAQVRTLMRRHIPAADLAFLRSFEDQIAIGDYLFVHAGIAPGVRFEDQATGDLRWIREPFLSHRQPHGAVVVHGHTITDDPVIRANRIGIDTGAYASGRLTALGLEGTQRWLIEARQDETGAIACATTTA